MAAPCSKSIRGVSACRLRNIRVRGVKKMTKLVWGAAAAALVAAKPALGADASQSTFGKLPDGRSVPGVTLNNGNGISATIHVQSGSASCREGVCPDGEISVVSAAIKKK